MPTHQYSAIDAEGNMVRGVLEAVDKNDVAGQLMQKGLFLVSCSVAGESVPAAASEPTPLEPTSLTSAQADDRGWAGEPLPLSRGWKLLACGILTAGIMLGVQQTYKDRHSNSALAPLNKKIALVRPGMSRTAVEQILGEPFGGGPDAAKTWYIVDPDMLVGITYDPLNLGTKAEQHIAKNSSLVIRRRPKP